jgi:hypothetical protein
LELFSAGGSVTNLADGTIASVYGVEFHGAPGAIVNARTIAGSTITGFQGDAVTFAPGVAGNLGSARDSRSLGVALRQVVLWNGRTVTVLLADDLPLGKGFHAFEAENGFRWTDGNALLPASLSDTADAGSEFELHVACSSVYEDTNDRLRDAA